MALTQGGSGGLILKICAFYLHFPGIWEITTADLKAIEKRI